MFDDLTTVRTVAERMAGEFDAGLLTGEQAVGFVREVGVIRRLLDGMLGQAAKRVEETSAYMHSGDRDAAQLYARAIGADASEARRAIITAKKLERLPETAAAVRSGRLSARQAELVAEAATWNPDAEGDLLAAAADGMVPLRDACVLSRAEVEDPTARAARQHAARRFRMWTSLDGMVEGHFSLTPEVGGQVKAAVDAATQRIFRARRASGPRERPDAYAADAFTEMVLGDLDADRGGSTNAKGAAATVHIVIDHAVLLRGSALPGDLCEIPGVGPVNVAWVREMLGDAFLTAVVKKGRDITTVAHFGRHVPAEFLTAMIVGGRECAVVGCSARGYLELDHSEVDFASGGPIAWWNNEWMCSPDHKRKTQGWKLGPRDPITGKRTLTPPACRE